MLCISVGVCETTAATFGKNFKLIWLFLQKTTATLKNGSLKWYWVKRERGNEKSKHQENMIDIDMEIA